MKKYVCLFLALLLFTGCIADKTAEIPEPTLEATPVVTIEPTPEPTPEPSPVPVTVEDAVNYTKKIVANPEIYGDGSTDLGVHKVIIPKIVDEGEAVKALNDKIYNVFGYAYEELKNDKEKSFIYASKYTFTNYKGIIGIVFETQCCPQGAGGGIKYCAFFYDSVNKKELTFDEYVSVLGYTKDELWAKIKETKEYVDYYAEYDEGRYKLIYAILDDKMTYVVFDMPDSLDGVMAYDVKEVLVK